MEVGPPHKASTSSIFALLLVHSLHLHHRVFPAIIKPNDCIIIVESSTDLMDLMDVIRPQQTSVAVIGLSAVVFLFVIHTVLILLQRDVELHVIN